MSPQEITVASVQNNVQIGALAGNRNLEFGVKNMLEEFLQEAGHDVSDDAPTQIKVEILYLDVLKTQSNLSVIDEGGKFNQTNLSSALKKSCNTLITKLL